MKVSAIKIKLFGRVGVVFRVLGKNGEVIFVAETKHEAKDWIAAKTQA